MPASGSKIHLRADVTEGIEADLLTVDAGVKTQDAYLLRSLAIWTPHHQ